MLLFFASRKKLYFPLCFLKTLLFPLTTTPLNANSAIIFGRAISPLKISAIVHTALTVIYDLINTAKNINPAVDFHMF